MSFTTTEFASIIRQKHWAYKDVEDEQLVEGYLKKYPQYQSQVQTKSSLQKWAEQYKEMTKMPSLFWNWANKAYQATRVQTPERATKKENMPQQDGMDWTDDYYLYELWRRLGSNTAKNAVGAWVFWLNALTGLVTDPRETLKTWVDMAKQIPGELKKQWQEYINDPGFEGKNTKEKIKKVIWDTFNLAYQNPVDAAFIGQWVKDAWRLLWKGATWVKNAKSFWKTMIDNPEFQVVDEFGKATGTKTDARTMVKDNFTQAGKNFADKFKTDIPTRVDWPKQYFAWHNTPKKTPTQSKTWPLRKRATETVAEKGGQVTDYVAQKMTGTQAPVDKLFKAVNPKINTLKWNKAKWMLEFKTSLDKVSSEMIAMWIIPKASGKPGTQSYVSAGRELLDGTWKVLEKYGTEYRNKMWQGITWDMWYVAEQLMDFIKAQEKAGVIADDAGIKTLLKQAQRFKQMGETDIAQMNWSKQVLNKRSFDKSNTTDISQVVQEWFKRASSAIGDLIDKKLSAVEGSWEIRALKEMMGDALKVIKELEHSLVIYERSKWQWGLWAELWRVWGLWDIAWGIASGKGSQIVKGAGKVIVWESLWKAKDMDWLIEQAFQEMSGKSTRKNAPTANQKSKSKKWADKVNEYYDRKNAEKEVFKKKEKQVAEKKEAKAKEVQKIKKEREQKKLTKKEKIKNQFEEAKKSDDRELMNKAVNWFWLKKWDITEYGGLALEDSYYDTRFHKVKTEMMPSGQMVWSIGRVLRKKWGNTPKKGLDKWPNEPQWNNWGKDGWLFSSSKSKKSGNNDFESVVKKSTDNAKKKSKLEDMNVWTSRKREFNYAKEFLWKEVMELWVDWQNLFADYLNASFAKRPQLMDDIILRYWDLEKRWEYIMNTVEDLAKQWDQKWLDKFIKNVETEWAWVDPVFKTEDYKLMYETIKETQENLTKPKPVSKVDSTLQDKKPVMINPKNYKTVKEFMLADIRSKNKYMSPPDTFKRLKDLDSQELNRSIWTTDRENIPDEVTLYRWIKEDIEFDLRPWDFLTKNETIAKDFAKWWKVKSFTVKSKDLLWDTFWNEEVIFAPMDHYSNLFEWTKKKSKIFRSWPDKFENNTSLVARERFDFNELEKISFWWSDRDVYSIWWDKVLKVAKTARWLWQNTYADWYLADAWLIPKIIEKWENYTIFERVKTYKEMTKEERKMIKSFADTLREKGQKVLSNPRKYEYMDDLNEHLEKIWRDDLMNYEPQKFGWNDIQPRNLWIRDWKPVLLDEWSINLVETMKEYEWVKNLEDEYFKEFYDRSKKAKKESWDTDSKTMY